MHSTLIAGGTWTPGNPTRSSRTAQSLVVPTARHPGASTVHCTGCWGSVDSQRSLTFMLGVGGVDEGAGTLRRERTLVKKSSLASSSLVHCFTSEMNSSFCTSHTPISEQFGSDTRISKLARLHSPR
jgi:hypothetical protein